ncbi:hypothetical protein FQN60_017123, partial [Etheostoma spectabile]
QPLLPDVFDQDTKSLSGREKEWASPELQLSSAGLRGYSQISAPVASHPQQLLSACATFGFKSVLKKERKDEEVTNLPPPLQTQCLKAIGRGQMEAQCQCDDMLHKLALGSARKSIVELWKIILDNSS